jgi:hypothetical protein
MKTMTKTNKTKSNRQLPTTNQAHLRAASTRCFRLQDLLRNPVMTVTAAQTLQNKASEHSQQVLHGLRFATYDITLWRFAVRM